MSQYDRTDRSAYLALGMVLGAAVGVVAGMLSAPKSGEELREELFSRAERAKRKTKDQLTTQQRRLATKVDEAADKSKSLIDSAGKRASDALNKADR